MSANVKAEYVKDVETLIRFLNDPNCKGQFIVYHLNQRDSVFLVKDNELFHYDRDGRPMAADLISITSKLGLKVHDVSREEKFKKDKESAYTSYAYVDYGSPGSSTIENAIKQLEAAAKQLNEPAAAATPQPKQKKGFGFFKPEVSTDSSENISSTPRLRK